MSLKNQIQQELQKAVKAQDKQKRETLRFLWAQIQNKEIEQKRKELTDEQLIKIIKSQLKKLKESLILFEKGSRSDLANQTKKEIKILANYLP